MKAFRAPPILILLVASGLFAGSPAAAGSFDGKSKLLLHSRAITTKNACSPQVLDCANAVTEADLYPTTRFVYVLVHREGSMLDLAGVEFGIDYEGGNPAGASNSEGLDIYTWSLCGTLEWPTAGWPGPGSGNIVTWNPTTACRTTNTAVAGYFYLGAYSADVLSLTPRPGACRAELADCLSREWPIENADLGSVAFSAGATDPGCNPCDQECGTPVPAPVLSATAQCAGVQLDWTGTSPSGSYVILQDGLPNPPQPVPGTSYLVPLADTQSHCYEVAAFICETTIGTLSNAACLATDIALPAISVQPLSTDALEGESASFSVTASGVAAYQWRKVGGGNVGTNSPTLSLGPPLVIADAGDYVVDLTNLCGVVTSGAATLTVCSPLLVNTHPLTQIEPAGADPVFTVAATGTGPFGYRWHRDGAPLNDDPPHLTGTTSATLNLADITVADEGYYRCVITDDCGQSLASDDGLLTIVGCDQLPTISLAPLTQTVAFGGTAIITASYDVHGCNTPTFQWRFKNVALGAPSQPTLVLNNVQPIHAGAYTCQITADNVAAVSNISVLNTPAPTITKCLTKILSCSMIRLEWCTLLPTTARVEYGPTPALGSVADFGSTTCGFMIFTKTTNNKVYFRLTVTDVALNSSQCMKVVAFPPGSSKLTLIAAVDPFYTAVPPASSQALGVNFRVRNTGCNQVNPTIQLRTPLNLGGAPPVLVSGSAYPLPKSLVGGIAVGAEVAVIPTFYFRRTQIPGGAPSGSKKQLTARLSYPGFGGGLMTFNVTMP